MPCLLESMSVWLLRLTSGPLQLKKPVASPCQHQMDLHIAVDPDGHRARSVAYDQVTQPGHEGSEALGKDVRAFSTDVWHLAPCCKGLVYTAHGLYPGYLPETSTWALEIFPWNLLVGTIVQNRPPLQLMRRCQSFTQAHSVSIRV